MYLSLRKVYLIMNYYRVQKILSQAGIASRRFIERLIKHKKIAINGEMINNFKYFINKSNCLVEIDRVIFNINFFLLKENSYFLLNKPNGFLTTLRDNCRRNTIMNLISSRARFDRLYPVGRLDSESEGALLVTNDGRLSNILINPLSHVKKIYIVKIKGNPKKNDLNKLRKGIYLNNNPTGYNYIRFIKRTRLNSWLKIILTKGRNCQIREMFWRIKHPIKRIIRINFAGINIIGLAKGGIRSLLDYEISRLKKIVL